MGTLNHLFTAKREENHINSSDEKRNHKTKTTETQIELESCRVPSLAQIRGIKGSRTLNMIVDKLLKRKRVSFKLAGQANKTYPINRSSIIFMISETRKTCLL
jgi:hypothetical protein